VMTCVPILGKIAQPDALIVLHHEDDGGEL
jgi:hypothetical protein